MITPLRFFLGAAAMVVLIILVNCLDTGASVRNERVDQLSPGPYVVTRDTHSGPEYLAWTNIGKGWDQNWVPNWTPELDRAWRYAERSSAQEETRTHGGEAKPLREVRG